MTDKVDFSLSIRSVAGGAPAEYVGVQTMRSGAPIDDSFRHLVITGKSRVNYVDDFGRILTSVGLRQIVENTPVVVAAAVGVADTSELADVIEQYSKQTLEQFTGLRRLVLEQTQALAGVVEALKGVSASLRAAGAAQQQAFLDANLMLIEELKKTLPKDPEPAPPPAVQIIKKPAVVRDLAAIGRAVGTASIKGLEKLGGRECQQILTTLALVQGISSIAVGGYDGKFQAPSAAKRGTMKFMGDIQGGIKAKIYTETSANEVFIYLSDPTQRHAIINLIESIGTMEARDVR